MTERREDSATASRKVYQVVQNIYKSPGEKKEGIHTDKRRTAAASSNICSSNHDPQPLGRGCEISHQIICSSNHDL